MSKKNKLYRILEPGGLTHVGKHFEEHQIYDLVAEGWGQGDIPGAVQSGLIAEAGEVEAPVPAKTETKMTAKEKEDD